VSGILRGFTTVDQIARWAASQTPAFRFAGSYAYENRTHDIVVVHPSDSLAFVLEARCDGELRRITVWDGLPTSIDLFAARLERKTGREERHFFVGATCRFGGHVLTPSPAGGT